MEVWVEKYRPTDLFDVVGNQAVLERLRGMAAQGHMPNLILAGAPGVGKTTSVLCLAKALLGEYAKVGVLELNASDDRGIDVVRDRIKNFAHQKVTLPPGRHKIIILDEADSMTDAAQQALRRTMELCSATTRFALACNQSSKLIEPIQSRCAILRFTKLNDSEVLSRLNQVAEMEKVVVADSGLEALVFTAEGDMRNALNNMQSAFVGFGTITRETVLKVCDTPQPQDLAAALDACIRADWDRGYDTLESLVNKGYSVGDVIGSFLRVLKNYEMREDLKIEFTKEIAITHLRVTSDGVQTLTQVGGLVARLCRVAEQMVTVGARAG
jgi:replication factor C subunit 2/4